MTKINWDDKPLGLIPDQALAGMLGVSISTVRDQRILRGIMSSTDMVRQECMADPEFLTANAKDLAAKYGVSFVSVYAWRRKGGKRKPTEANQELASNKLSRDPRLGKVRDTALAREFGVSREMVRRIRVKLGIPRLPWGKN